MYEVVKKKAKKSTMSLSAYGLNSFKHLNQLKEFDEQGE